LLPAVEGRHGVELPPSASARGLTAAARLEDVAAADHGAPLVEEVVEGAGAIVLGFADHLAETGRGGPVVHLL
jgi:hypothetical protein